MLCALATARRRLGLLALFPLALGLSGCGSASGGKGLDPVRDATKVSETAKENYLKSRAERKAQNPNPVRSGPYRTGRR